MYLLYNINREKILTKQRDSTIDKLVCYSDVTTYQVTKELELVLGPSQSSARLGSVLARAFGKKSSTRLAMPSKKLGSAHHILQKKLGSALLALSFKKPSYLGKQKMC